MLRQTLSWLFPSLAPTLQDRSKPLHLQAFQTFALTVYPFFLLFLVTLQLSQSIVCTTNSNDVGNGLIEDACLFEEGHIIDYRLFQVKPANEPSTKTDRPKYLVKNGRKYEIVPGISPLKPTDIPNGPSYNYFTTYIWIDLAFFAQILLFLLPGYLWSTLRGLKFITVFKKGNWSLYGEAPSTLETTSKADTFQLERSLQTLFRISLSNLSVNLITVTISQLVVILVMTAFWDFLFNFGSRGESKEAKYQFSTFGFHVLQYWWAWCTWDGKGTFPEEDPSEVLFPFLVKCTYQRYGPAQSLMSTDLFCAIEANLSLSKLFIVIWFYYAFAFLTGWWVLLFHYGSLSIRPLRRRYIRSILVSGLHKETAKRRKDEYDRVIGDFACPLPVAVFVSFLISNIGSRQTSIILERFILTYNSHLGPGFKSQLDATEQPSDFWADHQRCTQSIEMNLYLLEAYHQKKEPNGVDEEEEDFLRNEQLIRSESARVKKETQLRVQLKKAKENFLEQRKRSKRKRGMFRRNDENVNISAAE